MFRKLFSRKTKVVKPDQPIGFGYKNKWIALKTQDRYKVATFLKLNKVQESNWHNGVKFAYKKGVFITPEIKGWTLAVGIDISEIESQTSYDFLQKASIEFGECQIFQTHRVIEYHFWGQAINGNITRLYSYNGESGENLIVDGTPTAIEKSMDLVNTFSDESESEDYWERSDLIIPDEEIVMKIAENWSVNPVKIEQMTNLDGKGLIGK